MEPYIKSVDTSTPLGKLVYKYGEGEYYKGLIIGFIVGFGFSILIHKKSS